MSNIVEPQITETKPSMFSDFIKNNPNVLQNIIGNTSSTPVLCKDGTTKNQLSSPNARYDDACRNNGGRADLTSQQKAQLELAQQQALMQKQALMEQMTRYNSVTDKVFGKQEGWSFERPMRLGAYIIVGAVVGRYVAKNMKKSTTLGMVLGGLAPLLAYQLSIEYDKKNMLKQEPRQKVAIEPTPTQNKPKTSLFDNSKYPMECMMRYAQQPKPEVMMPTEYWKKREEDWMKTNCK